MSDKTIVIVQDAGGEVVLASIVPTAQINKRDKADIIALAAKHQQNVSFYEAVGWVGIEALKWDLKTVNGET